MFLGTTEEYPWSSCAAYAGRKVEPWKRARGKLLQHRVQHRQPAIPSLPRRPLAGVRSAPRRGRMRRGLSESSSTAARDFEMCTSMERSKLCACEPLKGLQQPIPTASFGKRATEKRMGSSRPQLKRLPREPSPADLLRTLFASGHRIFQTGSPWFPSSGHSAGITIASVSINRPRCRC